MECDFVFDDDFQTLSECNDNEDPYVIIPDCVTKIGAKCFVSDQSLVFMKIPGKIKVIGDAAFCNCKELLSVVIEDGFFEKREVRPGAFAGCIKLENVSIGKGVKKIGFEAFNECLSLRNISLPEGLEIIEDAAFSECAIKSIVIPSTVKNIGEGIFIGCEQLQVVLMPSGFDIDSVFYGVDVIPKILTY